VVFKNYFRRVQRRKIRFNTTTQRRKGNKYCLISFSAPTASMRLEFFKARVAGFFIKFMTSCNDEKRKIINLLTIDII